MIDPRQTYTTPIQPAKRIARINGNLYDLGTSNKSFLQLAMDLKKLGVKNWYFMLEIKDPSVVKIDPFATDKNTGKSSLSKDQITRVINEITVNPWYYLREVSLIPDIGGIGVHYLANRGNIAQAYCILHGYDSWLCLPRQKGKTQSALAIMTWAYNFGTTNSDFIFTNKTGDDSKTNLRRMKTQIDLLPEYLRFASIIEEDGTRTKSKDNATIISNPITKNTVITKNKATSYDTALSLARGLTSPIIHYDEPEFTNYIKVITENSVSTYEQAAESAKRNHTMYARIFTCTPGDLDTKCGQEAQEILDKTCKWTEKIYDWTDDQVKEYIDNAGKDCNKILYIEYHYYQIGLIQQWLEEISAKIGNPLVVRREILLQRLHGSSLSPFPQEDIEYIVETEKKPIDELWLLEYFKFDIYEALNKTIPYLVGVDCSTGTGSDNNSITILNPYTLCPVAEFESSYIGETKYVKLIIELIRNHIPRAVLCIERNSVGDAIIDFLLNSPIRGNLYFDKDKDLQEEKMKRHETVESMLKREAKQKTYYGVYTEGTSREDMFAILSRHVNEYKEKFVAHNLIRDLSRLVRTRSGKIEAGPGFHDDAVMSYLMTLYVYYHGNNLGAFGIVKGLRDEEIKNEGMKRAEEINPSLVDRSLIQEVMAREKIEREENYDDILRKALLKSQKESYVRYKKGMTNDDLIQNTPEGTFNDYEEEGTIDLSFFNELNGF